MVDVLMRCQGFLFSGGVINNPVTPEKAPGKARGEKFGYSK